MQSRDNVCKLHSRCVTGRLFDLSLAPLSQISARDIFRCMPLQSVSQSLCVVRRERRFRRTSAPSRNALRLRHSSKTPHVAAESLCLPKLGNNSLGPSVHDKSSLYRSMPVIRCYLNDCCRRTWFTLPRNLISRLTCIACELYHGFFSTYPPLSQSAGLLPWKPRDRISISSSELQFVHPQIPKADNSTSFNVNYGEGCRAANSR